MQDQTSYRPARMNILAQEMLPLLGIILVHQNGLKWWRTDRNCPIWHLVPGWWADRWNVGHFRLLRFTTIKPKEKK